MVKEIILTNGDIALVDDEDYEEVSRYKWNYSNSIEDIATTDNKILASFIGARMGLDLSKGRVRRKDKNMYNNTRNNLMNEALINQHRYTDTNLGHIRPNLLCAIDIITTGPDPTDDDIIEICILPLNGTYEPHKGILPFSTLIKPVSLGFNITDTRLIRTLNRATSIGIKQPKALDLFHEWFEKLKLSGKIVPLAKAWLNKRDFLIKWMGNFTLNKFFSLNYRDVIQATCYINDKCDYQQSRAHEKISYTEHQSEVRAIEPSKDLFITCIKIAERYKKLLSSLY